MESNKRPSSPDNVEESEENDSWIGPMPSEAVKSKSKKQKGNYMINTILRDFCQIA